MKRRRSSAHLTDPQTIRKSPSRGIIDGVKSSIDEDEDVQVLRRVKFRDPEPSKLPSSRQDICQVQNDGTQSPGSELPKTSEYAFFKKVKKNARGHSYPLQKNNNRLNDGEFNECAKHILDKVKRSYKDLRPSLPIKNPKPINQKPHFSPPDGVSRSQDSTCNDAAVNNTVNPTSKGITSPPFVEKVNSRNDYFLSSPFSCGSKKEGNQFSEGIFATRRQRLRGWISNSLPKLDESCSEGDDLVDVLLSRLFPENDENHYRSRQTQIDTRHSRPSSSALDTRNSIGFEHGSDLDDGFFEYGSKRPKYIVLPELDTLDSDYSSTFDEKYSKALSKRSYPEIGSFHDLPHPRYKSITWNLEELDEFHEPNTAAPKEEPRTLLIGWDFKSELEEQELSIMPKATELNLFSWGNYYLQKVHGNFHASTPCSSSLFSKNYLHPSLDFPPNHDSRSYLLDEKYHISHSPKYLKMTEEDSASDCELDFGLTDPLTERYSSNHHEIFEGTLIPNDWPILNFQIPSVVDTGPVICPLLLDNADWTQSQQEIYRDDDDEDEWRYI